MINQVLRSIAAFAVAIAVVVGLTLSTAPAAGAAIPDGAPTATGIHLASTTGPLAAPGNLIPANWFSDWQTCIWGIGVPAALAWRYPGWAKAAASKALRGARGAYGSYVIAACERFIRS